MLNRWKKRVIVLGILMVMLALTLNVEAKTKGNIYGDKVNYYKSKNYFVCEGNARLEYKDYHITAESIEYYEKEEKAIFTGNVVVLQGKNKITGQKMTANLKKDEFEIDGEVYIYYVRKSKDAEESNTEKQDPSTATDAAKKDSENNRVVELKAKHVVYKSGDNDHLIATDSVVMEVEEDTIKADYLEYKGGEEIVIAKGNVEVLGEDDERITTEEFLYRIEGEDEGFDAKGGVQLEFYIDDEDEEEAAEPASNPANVSVKQSTGGKVLTARKP